MPTALLVHGLSSSPGSLWRVRDWLAETGWEVASRALLGHAGRPEAERYTLADYADDLVAGASWDLVVGHSLGGSTATLAASREPAWTARLVVIDPAWHIPASELAGVRAGEEAELALTPADLDAEHPTWDERDREAKLEGIRTIAPGALGRTFDDNPEWDLRAAARALAIPTLLLTGDPSVFSLVAPDDARAVAAANPHVVYRPIAGTGHAPHRDAPEVVRDALLGWLG